MLFTAEGQVTPHLGPAFSHGRRHATALLGWLLGALLLIGSVAWDLLHLPGDPVLGLDFGAFYAAGVAWLHGYDPYNWTQLRAVEAQLQSVGFPHHPMFFNSYANPPLFAWAMAAFAPLAPRAAYVPWLALTAVAMLVGIAVSARSYGMRAGWLLLFAVTPAPVIALFLGQQTPLLLLGLAVALAALRRGRPELAGVALSIGWIKPHLLFPLVLVWAAMLGRRGASRLLAAFAAGSLVLGVASWLVTGGALLLSWARDLALYGHTMDTQQPNLSSLAGLYLSVLGRPWSGYLVAALVAVWLALAAAIVWRARSLNLSADDDAWLRLACIALTAWLLAIPYTHPADLVLLAVALPVALGRRFEGLRDSWVRLALGMLLVAPEADLLGFRPNFVLSYSVLVPLTLLLALRPWHILMRPGTIRADAASARPARLLRRALWP